MIFALLIGLVVMLACGGTKSLPSKSKAPAATSTEKKTKNYIFFTEKLRPGLKKGDSLKLYNNFDIQLTRDVTVHHPAITADGDLGDKDTTYQVVKTIPAKTPGGIMDVVHNKAGSIIKVTVKYSMKDDSYIIDWLLEDDVCYSQAKNNPNVKDPKEFYKTLVKKPGSFILGGKSTLIFKGQEYELTNKTTNSNGEEARLLAGDGRSHSYAPVTEQAEGWSLSGNTQTQNQLQTKQVGVKDTTKSGFIPSEH